MEENWSISVASGLTAFFKQRSGQSRPGTYWTVLLRRGSEERRGLVLTFSNEHEQGSPQQASRAAEYVAKLLSGGWNPTEYRGEPGELTVPDDTIN